MDNVTSTVQMPTRRNSLRLPGFDYASRCCYFVTIVAQGRACRFGAVIDDTVSLGAAGLMVENCYQQMLLAFPDLQDVAHVVMPNHLHFLVHNSGNTSVSEAVRWLKSKSTSEYIHGVKEQGWTRFDRHLWQTRFYDVIIRNDRAFDYVVGYIANNPARWLYDRMNEDMDVTKADDVGGDLRKVNW